MKNEITNYWRKRSMKKIVFLIIILIFSQKSNAQTWSGVGSGMCDWVNASVVYNGELVVGGRFTCAGGVPANYIAKWNGTSWSALGSGLNGWVWALTVYKGNLIVGGQFSQAGSTAVMNLAKWDGTNWTDVNGDVGSIVASLTVYNNDLIVGGYFTDADGFPANYIVGYNSNNGWFNLGSGMGGSQGQVMALNVYGGNLIAAGFFTTAGGTTANHIAKWNGTSWSSLGSGIGWITYSLGTYNGDLIAGGLFSSAGGISANSIAKWNGTSWSSLGSGMGATPVGYNYVFSLAEFNGNLYAGGMYSTAGGVTANSIAMWDGSAWHSMNGGVQYGGSNVFAVNALSVYNNDLYASGIFSSAGGVGVAHIAKWHDATLAVSCSVISDVTCHAGNNGSIIVTATGGTPPYTGTGTITGLTAGSHTQVVTDAHGNTASCSINISEPPPFIISSFAPASGCPGDFISILGSDFLSVTNVLFNGISASNFFAVDDNTIQAAVPAGVSSGIITLSNGGLCSDRTSAVPFTVNSCITNITLNLNFYIEGYYIGGGMMRPLLFNAGVSVDPLACDSVIIELHDSLNPNTIVASNATVVDVYGYTTMQFPASINGTSNYICIRTRNGLETWSKLPVTMQAVTNFDFTSP